MVENTYILNIRKRICFSTRIKARKMLRTAKDFEHERLGAHHVDEVALRILQISNTTLSNAYMETLEKQWGCMQHMKEPSNA